MEVIERKDITCFDCDETLVMWPDDYQNPGPGRISFEYGDETIWLIPHSFHPLFLKNCHKRGDFVIIWSQNGFAWANQIAEKLKLTDYVDIIMNKPSRHVDDKESLDQVLGNRIYLQHKGQK